MREGQVRDGQGLCGTKIFALFEIFGATLVGTGTGPPFEQTRVVPEYVNPMYPQSVVDLEVKDRLIFLDAG